MDKLIINQKICSNDQTPIMNEYKESSYVNRDKGFVNNVSVPVCPYLKYWMLVCVLVIHN